MTKQRLTKKQEAEKRRKALEEQAAVSKLLKGRGKSDKRKLVVNALPTLQYEDTTGFRSMPSAGTADAQKARKPVDYSENPEMAAREAAAQEEKDRKRKRLAPAYNKGPVMYITDDTNPAELGRKL